MTAQEFVQYMTVDALVSTIVNILENFDPNDAPETALDVSWSTLVAWVGEQEASELVGFQDMSEVLS